MTQKDFIRSFANIYQVQIADAEIWINSIFDYLFDAIIKEDQVRMPFIGTIRKDYIYPTTRYDINTKKYVEKPGRMTIKYLPAKKLEDKIKLLPPDPTLASITKQNRRNKRTSVPQKKTAEEIAEMEATKAKPAETDEDVDIEDLANFDIEIEFDEDDDE